MRKTALLVFIFMSTTVFGQQQGIEFASVKWNEIVKKAKEENKLIFFDAYTSWCGPCIRLQTKVFPDKELGEYYNKNFINVKYDMEKGEGVNLSKKFAIQVYPTLLFIDPRSEKVINHAIGYKNPQQLIQIAEQSMLKANM